MRNIVLITLDALRADHCSFMGYERKTTPTLDRMAKDGLYFENAVASGVATVRSMTGVFTADYLINYSNEFRSVRKETINKFKKQKSLAQVLSQIGYSTGAFTPNVYTSRYFGFNKGFEYFQDFSVNYADKGLWGTNKRILDRLLQKQKWISSMANIKYLILKERACKPWESYYDQILDWIEKTDRPVFLWIHLLGTHHPYIVPRRFRKWGNFFDMYLYNWKVRAAKWHPEFSEEDRKKLVNAYDDAILYTDAFINKLWKDMEDEDPIFILHADHGDGFGDHGFYGHDANLLYEELIHVPLVVYNADVKGKMEKPVSLLGLFPTILDLVGDEKELPSESFLYGGGDWVISKVFDDNGRKLAIRMKDWKFITGQRDEDELYCLKNDPYEQENLIDMHPDLVKEMRKIVENHVKHELEKRRLHERISKLKV